VRRAIMVSAALLATLLLGPPSGATPSSPPGKSAPTPDQLTRPRPPGLAALNVGDGFLDVAVGVPREDVGAKADAGAVDVLLGFLEGSGDLGSGSFTLTQGANAEPGDLFGGAITTGDFNVDGFVDLAVGAPGEDVGGIVDAGAVNLFLTTPDGFLADTPSRTLTQGANAEPGDRFGATLAAGELVTDHPSGEDLAVGAPGEDVGSIADAGAVNIFLTSGASGPPTTPSRTLTQGGNAESGDQFGAAVDVSLPTPRGPGLAVGAPGENVGAVADAGAVNIFFTSGAGGPPTTPSQTLTQGGNAESGDRFGTALASGVFGRLADFLAEGLAVGAPGEDVGAVADAGAVNVFYPDPNGGVQTPSQTLTQGGNVEPGDQFGRAVDAGGFGGDSGHEELVVGAPGEDVGAVADAGAANVFATDAGGVRTPFARTLTQSGLNEGGDRFGATLAASFQNNDNTEDLAVGVPGEDAGTRTDAGAVNAFNGSQSGLSGGRLFTQFVNVESGDGFGAALGGLFPAL
jgi:hypothetical protein